MAIFRWSAAQPLIRLLPLLFVILAAGGVTAEDEALQWPLPLKPALSSTFGETRSTAFHAGIDLKTWGKTGYPVHAAGDGWIERARTSPWGFGRVVYLRLTDGRIAVYAHLDSFFTPVQERIRAEQRRQGHYSVQLWFEKGEIPVERGQVIAATGQTGAGPPHLHFELRDSGNVPMNALLHAFRVADTQAPTLRRLLVVPRGPGSLADGRHDPVIVPVRWQAAQQRYVATRSVSVFGRIGIGIEAFDTADAAKNKMAPLQLALRRDGRDIFSSRLHRVSIADWHQVALDRWRQDGHVFSNLFLRAGNRLPFYTSDGSAGWLFAGGDGLPPGDRKVEVVAKDVAGNEALAVLNLAVAASYQEALMPHAATGVDQSAEATRSAASVELIPHERFAVLRLRGPQPEATVVGRPIDLQPSSDGHVGLISYANLADPGLTVPVMVRFDAAGSGSPDTTLQISTRRIRPGLAQRLDYDEGRVLLHLDAGSAYEEIVPQVRSAPPVATPGLRATALGFDFEPQTISFDKWARISFSAPPGRNPGKLGVYVSDGDGGWVFIGNDLDGETAPGTGTAYEDVDDETGGSVAAKAAVHDSPRVSARIRAFGHFALLEDVTPPTLSTLRPRSKVWLDDRRPLLRARVVDHGSGIGAEADLSIELNGRKLIHIYDPEADELTARPDEPLADGEYVWTVRARDQSGNEAEVSDVFGLR